ncbi:16S rRNA (cytidine(1402)-2'-O)-methyltransferase [Altererythrobacter sp. ZODW24]|uniref:16S rRNA (cytidine(1402)-2'-O)-methyltransferase n=1 Tax=Altererythrobacter sp. ZODW24 TaxID=2185142 RepID=UPI001F084F68|nr:16S rRNA (cytidine(1402)-2'-O)-methyltransferase [Altererythrobacter sp. ZODW24]
MTETAPHPEPPEKLPPGLYIVATPIGNLGDITMRAQDILARCAGVACEDTRVTGKLMKHLGLSKPLWRYDDHSGEKDRARLVDSMQSRAVALVSDAGTPLIADPGYRLVQDAREAGTAVTSIPGPNAITTALTLSGLPNDRFLFAGFLPSKEKARREVLLELAPVRTTLIFYETGPRLTKSLAAIDENLPGREVSVARELTKLFEECRTGTAAGLTDHYTAHPPKGEIVLLIGPPADAETSAKDADDMLRAALETSKASQAAGEVARATGLDRKALYARAMEIRGE